MTGDWIRLHRKIIFSQAWCSEGLLMVWIWCLLRANWRETWVPVTTGRGTTQVKLRAGQFIFGRKTAAKELRMKPSTVRDRMHRLVKMGNIAMQADTHFTVVSVNNWETYQSSPEESATQPATQPTGKQQATATHPTQSKKGKKEQEGKEKKPPKSPKGDKVEQIPIPDGIDTEKFRTVWADWITYRRQKRQPLTVIGATQQLKKMSEIGEHRAVAMILNTVEKGWQGLQEPSDNNYGGKSREYKPGPGQRHPDDVDDRPGVF